MTRKTFWLIFAIAAALRLFAIWRAPLWYDENFTLILARMDFASMIKATAGDVHPPLWYLIEWTIYHAWTNAPAWVIRLPAAAFSLLALYTFDQLCKRIQLPARTRIISLALMAVLPFQIWYAQEGRMYALLEFLVLYALYAGLARKWHYFTAAAIAMVYTQNYGLIYMLTISCVLIIEDNFFETWKPIVSAGTITGILYMPWSYVIQLQMTEITGRYWIMDASAGAVLNAIYKQFWASAMLEPGIITGYVLTFAALILGTIYLIRSGHSYAPHIISMAYMPIVIAWLVSVVWQPILLFRPLIGVSPFLYILAALPLAEASLKTTRVQVLAACFASPLFMFGVSGYYLNIAPMKNDGAVSPMIETLDYIKAHWQEGDVIYYTDDGPMINLMPYAGDLPQYKMPGCGEEVTGYAPVLGSLSDTTRAALNIPIMTLDDVPHRRAWVFAPRSPLHPQCYEAQIASIAPVGKQIITVDDNQYITSGVWLIGE